MLIATSRCSLLQILLTVIALLFGAPFWWDILRRLTGVRSSATISSRRPGPSEHAGGQGRLGGKPDLLGDACRPAAVGVVDPAWGHIELPVDHGVPGIGGVQEVCGDLGVLDATRGAGELALHPTDWMSFLRSPVSSMTSTASGRPGARRGSRGGHREPRRGPTPLGLAGAASHPGWGCRRGSTPAEPARDPAQQLLQPRLPTGGVNLSAVACGHRLSFGCPHNNGSSPVAALVCSPALPTADQADNDLRLEY
jgi:hypothetical protein